MMDLGTARIHASAGSNPDEVPNNSLAIGEIISNAILFHLGPMLLGRIYGRFQFQKGGNRVDAVQFSPALSPGEQ